MAIQTTYNETLASGKAGSIVNTEPKTLISRTVENADGVDFGLAVSQGTADSGCHKTTTGDTKILGIAVRDRSVNPETPNKFAQYDSARVMTKGVVLVTANATVAAGDPVHVVVADNTFTNTGGVQITNARYDSSGTSGDLVAVRLA